MRVAAILALLAAQEAPKPEAFEGRGKLVCLIEEMKEKYQAQASAVHDHLWGFRTDVEGKARYYTVFRNALSEALFVDQRFREHELRLTGRVFPSTSLLEVTRFQWYREGKLRDLYYWCEVCAIRGVDPGACACCQDKVELREAPADESKK